MNLMDLLGRTVLVFDGAMGTMLQAMGLPRGACPESWCLEHPDRIAQVHRMYVEAGAQIIETNTFGATPLRLSHYGLESRVRDINIAAVRIAREASAGRALVAGSMGPLGVLVEPLGDFPFRRAYEEFAAQARVFREANPDFIIIETIADLNEMRAAILACKDHAPEIPIIAQMTLEPSGRTYTGTGPETAGLVMQSLGACIIGFNCSSGPEQLVSAVLRLASVARVPVSVQPNAGMPRLDSCGETVFPMGPEEFASYGPKLVAAGACMVGGCCGTTPEHIMRLRAAVEGLKPQTSKGSLSQVLGLTSRTQHLFFVEDNLPVPVGERINPTGRKLLARDISEGAFEMVKRDARLQVEKGARVLDINVGIPLIDESRAMEGAVRTVQNAVQVPVCIDSVSPEAIKAGLETFVGKALVNSFSMEPGRAESILPIAKRYGAAVIGLTVDERGIPETAEERLHIARRLVEAAESYGIPRWDVVIDPLALTLGAQQSQAFETLKAIRLIRDELGCATSLGISNVSFGLPNRQFINAVYLAMALSQGLDMAIVNPLDERIMDVIRTARVIMNRDRNALEYISVVGPKRLVHTSDEARATESSSEAERKRSVSARTGAFPPTGSSPQEQDRSCYHELYRAILQGDKAVALRYVQQALSDGHSAIEILEKCMIPAIRHVGELYAEGIYFLPQLILSASAMKKAFEFLKPYIQQQRSGKVSGATVIMATVEGDMHDIGKSIVGAVLEGHGFRVIDLGKDVKAETILSETLKHKADLVCLSALMTTTMPAMKKVIDLFQSAGCDCPVIVGGAAVTREFAQRIGAAGYGRDAYEAVSEALRILEERTKMQG